MPGKACNSRSCPRRHPGRRPYVPTRDILSGLLRRMSGRPLRWQVGPHGSVLMANDLVDVIWRVSGTYEGAAQADIIHHWSTTSGNDKRGQRCTAHSLRTEI